MHESAGSTIDFCFYPKISGRTLYILIVEMDGGEIRPHRDPQGFELAAHFIAAFGFLQPDHIDEPAVPGGRRGGMRQFDLFDVG